MPLITLRDALTRSPVGLTSAATLAQSEGLTLRLTEHDALLELNVMLRTLDHERVAVSEKTALPSASALRLLSGKLPTGDFYPWIEKQDKWDQQIGPIKAFAWPMLLQAGGLAVRNGSRLALSPAGVKALAANPAESLRTLWRKWLKTTLLDEFSRIDAIKGQTGTGRVMTAVAPRRKAIEEALQQCPVQGWVDVDEFSRFMQASELNFEVTHDPFKLYISERQYGSLGYSGSHDWSILQGRYISALLFEYAATLGMIDVAYFDPKDSERDENFRSLWGTDELSYLSPYDGLSLFRLTALGAYVLGRTDSYQPQDMPLPETVESFTSRCDQDTTALKLGARAVLVECRDTATAQAIAEHKDTRALCLRAGPKTLVVRSDKLDKFRTGVHLLGLGMVS